MDLSVEPARMRVVVVPERAAPASPRWCFCDAVLPSLSRFDEALVRTLEE